MTDTTPLPCPLCHAEAPQVYESRHHTHCNRCGTIAPTTAWNTRANADARLVEALRGLAGNAGALKAFEWEIREVCGNTNWQCLMDAIAKADAALSEVSRG